MIWILSLNPGRLRASPQLLTQRLLLTTFFIIDRFNLVDPLLHYSLHFVAGLSPGKLDLPLKLLLPLSPVPLRILNGNFLPPQFSLQCLNRTPQLAQIVTYAAALARTARWLFVVARNKATLKFYLLVWLCENSPFCVFCRLSLYIAFFHYVLTQHVVQQTQRGLGIVVIVIYLCG
jgi:hypothetical protein